MLVFAPQAPQADREKAAHRFAAAFLVPASAVKREFPTKRNHLSLDELYSLKHKWGFSMQAWIRRLFDLEIISLHTYRQAFVVFRQRGWSQEEPGKKQVKPEVTRRFQRLVIQAEAENLVSPARAAELLQKPLEQVREEMEWPTKGVGLVWGGKRRTSPKPALI